MSPEEYKKLCPVRFDVGATVRCVEPESGTDPKFDLSGEVVYEVEQQITDYAVKLKGLPLIYHPSRFVLITNTPRAGEEKNFSYRQDDVQPVVKQSDGWSSDYYLLPQDAKELGDLIEHKSMNFNVGNIFKAAYRLGGKPGVSQLYDLNKIKWFVEREIARVKKEQN